MTPAAQDNKEFLANLPDVLEKARADGGIPGMSVAILHKGELVFAQGFGKRNRSDPFTKEVNKQTQKNHCEQINCVSFSHDVVSTKI